MSSMHSSHLGRRPPHIQVHAGFDGDYKSTAPAMKEALEYVMGRFPKAPLWITGAFGGGGGGGAKPRMNDEPLPCVAFSTQTI